MSGLTYLGADVGGPNVRGDARPHTALTTRALNCHRAGSRGASIRRSRGVDRVSGECRIGCETHGHRLIRAPATISRPESEMAVRLCVLFTSSYCA